MAWVYDECDCRKTKITHVCGVGNRLHRARLASPPIHSLTVIESSPTPLDVCSPFGLKSDFGGHDQRAIRNVYAYLAETAWFDGPSAVWNTYSNQMVGHELYLVSNMVVQNWCQNGPWPGEQYVCQSNFTIGMSCFEGESGSSGSPSILANNTYALPLGQVTPPPLVYECGMPLQEYQAACEQCDPGSVAVPFPPDDEILGLARILLGMPPS